MKEVVITLKPDAKHVHVDALRRLDPESEVDHKGRICCCVTDETLEELKNMPEIDSIQVSKKITETESGEMVKEPEKVEGDEGFAHHEPGHDEPSVKEEGTVMDEYTRTRPDANNDGVPDDKKGPPVAGETDVPVTPLDKEELESAIQEEVKSPKKRGRKSAAEKAADEIKAQEEPDVPANDEAKTEEVQPQDKVE